MVDGIVDNGAKSMQNDLVDKKEKEEDVKCNISHGPFILKYTNDKEYLDRKN
jgi:hypothetical protein